MDKKIYIYFAEHDIYFGEQMFTLVNINLELKSALRTKYWFYQTLLYQLYTWKPDKKLIVPDEILDTQFGITITGFTLF